jgi:hypothetical protein
MSLAAATAAAIGTAWPTSWWLASTRLLSEATSVGALLLLLALTPRLLKTAMGAAGLAAVTVAAWLVRPNLGAYVGVVGLAFVFCSGPQAALRSRALWTYVLSFVALHRATAWALGAFFGIEPYAHYGIMLQTLSRDDVSRFQAVYGDTASFVIQHWQETGSAILSNVNETLEHFFIAPTYLFVGWVAVPGIIHVSRRRGEENFPLALMAIAGCTFTVIGVLAGWGFARWRYPLLAAFCFWLVGMSAFDWAAERFRHGLPSYRNEYLLHALAAVTALALTSVAILTAWGFDLGRYRVPGIVCLWLLALAAFAATAKRFFERRGDHRRPTLALFTWLPLVAMLGVCLIAIPGSEFWEVVKHRYGLVGVRPLLMGGKQMDAISQAFCPRLAPNATVASPNPWSIYYWCGNAGYLVPDDLTDLSWLDRYLDEMKPGYMISGRTSDVALFDRSPRLEAIARVQQFVLYRVRDARSNGSTWRSPGPLADLGPR